jgi:hypothetical protein
VPGQESNHPYPHVESDLSPADGSSISAPAHGAQRDQEVPPTYEVDGDVDSFPNFGAEDDFVWDPNLTNATFNTPNTSTGVTDSVPKSAADNTGTHGIDLSALSNEYDFMGKDRKEKITFREWVKAWIAKAQGEMSGCEDLPDNTQLL